MSQINPIRSLLTFLYKIGSILSLHLHLGLNNFLFLSGFATKYTYLFIYFYSHIYYTPHPPHPPLPGYPNKVWSGAEIMKLPNVKYSTSICYFPSGPNIFSNSWFSSTPSLPSISSIIQFAYHFSFCCMNHQILLNKRKEYSFVYLCSRSGECKELGFLGCESAICLRTKQDYLQFQYTFMRPHCPIS